MRIWINADDYGLTDGTTKAIIDAFEDKFISTTTACVNSSSFQYAMNLLKGTPYENKVGIHMNITEGIPLTEGIKSNNKFCQDGHFTHQFNNRTKLSLKDKEDVYDELIAQVRGFRETGVNINHIDSHHHVHNYPEIFPIVMRIAKEENIGKIRLFRNYGSLPFYKLFYKSIYNEILKCNSLNYTQAFGMEEDYTISNKKIKGMLELMVHPDISGEGILVDRRNGAFEVPMGKPLSELCKLINDRGDTIIV